jgi:hypothetical protein
MSLSSKISQSWIQVMTGQSLLALAEIFMRHRAEGGSLAFYLQENIHG